MPDLPRLVLVTGSRALALHLPALEWLYQRLNALRPDLLVTGAAKGPDRWAFEWFRHTEPPMRACIYSESGVIVDSESERRVRWTERRPPLSSDHFNVWREWFLLRDSIMVDHVARRASAYDVLVVAMVASWSKTMRTNYTVGLASTHGLKTEMKIWQQEEPKENRR